MSKANKEWRQRNPEKVRAHWMVSNAIRYGTLERKPCEVCGNEKSHAHHNDYSKPLEIEWLCHRCHWDKHGWVKQPKVKGAMRSDAKKPHLFNKAVELRSKGMSYKEIGDTLKCSNGTVYKWINNVKYK